MNIVFTSDLSGLGGGEVGIIYLVEELSKENECLVICRTEGSLSESLHRLGITTAIVDYKDKKHLIAALLSLRKTSSRTPCSAMIRQLPFWFTLAWRERKPRHSGLRMGNGMNLDG